MTISVTWALRVAHPPSSSPECLVFVFYWMSTLLLTRIKPPVLPPLPYSQLLTLPPASLRKIQSTLEQVGFELHGSSYMQIFFNTKYSATGSVVDLICWRGTADTEERANCRTWASVDFGIHGGSWNQCPTETKGGSNQRRVSVSLWHTSRKLHPCLCSYSYEWPFHSPKPNPFGSGSHAPVSSCEHYCILTKSSIFSLSPVSSYSCANML